MKTKILSIAAVNAAILAIGSSAWSATTFDSTVTTAPGMGPDANSSTGYIQTAPNNTPANGNVNGGFKVVTSGNLELGLRAKLDHSNTFPDNGNGVYAVPTGPGNNFFGGPANPARASWNYEFSIATSSGLLGAYTYQLLVDSDPGFGDSFTSYDPLLLTDNGGNGVPAIPGTGVPAGALSTLAQNSENAMFGFPGGVPGYDPSIAGIYDIELIATPLTGGPAIVDEITVDVGDVSTIPDATATLPLLGSALVGMALIGRKVKAKA